MKNRRAKVYLVGAGPGDPGLITVKGIECIAAADVVIYDELASAELLRSARDTAELIYVGKKAGNHALPQDEIGELLVRHARDGKTVCRLKGGDPFLFGRGGEEAELLSKNNIEYEIVPGVTSAIAAPAYAGIPVTQRGVTSGVAIFTGHEDPTKETSDLNWEAIANLNTTLLFLMGMKNLPLIVKELEKHGMKGDTPVAVVHRGTTPFQKVVTGTLDNIVSIVEKESIHAPSIIVVGKVVNLRDTLSWVEKKPLFGKGILVTRTRRQASRLSSGLSELGAAVFEFPTIEIEPNRDAYPALDKRITEINGYDWIIFTSMNGVEVFMDRLSALGLDSRAFAGAKICAIGTATRDALKNYSLNADIVPEKYIAESILDSFRGRVGGKRILLPRADIARDALYQGLVSEGALVDVIDIYKTKIATGSRDELKELVMKADIVTFTSSSTVENFVEILGDEFEDIKDEVRAASIGPITTETIKKHGIRLVCEADVYNIEGLVDAIIDKCVPPSRGGVRRR